MNDKQLEAAAREYCRLTQRDPDEHVGHGADPDANGMTTMQLIYSRRWEHEARRIHHHWMLSESIRHAISKP